MLSRTRLLMCLLVTAGALSGVAAGPAAAKCGTDAYRVSSVCGNNIRAVVGTEFDGQVATASIDHSVAEWDGATIYWGDGTSDDVSISDSGVYGTHTYDSDGTFPVTVIGYGDGTGDYSGLSGSATGSSTATVTATSRPYVQDSPSVSGAKQVGETLTADPGTWDPPASGGYTYQWQRCNDAGAACEDIGDDAAGNDTLQLSEAERGKRIRVRVTASNSAGQGRAFSYYTAVVGRPRNTTAPSVSGVRQIGETLHADPGIWNADGQPYAYQWQRCNSAGAACTDVADGQAQDYQLVEADRGARMRVRVTASNAYGTASELTYPTPRIGRPVNLPGGQPAVYGVKQVDEVLHADHGEWTGVTEPYAYQWRRCDGLGNNCTDIDNATSEDYTLVEADRGARMRVEVTGSNAGGNTTAMSYPTAKVGRPVNTVAPSISGTTTVDETLTADPQTWSPSGDSYSYRWQRCAGGGCADTGAPDSQQYVLVAADQGKRMRVIVTATNGSGSVSKASAQTVRVAAAPPHPSVLSITHPNQNTAEIKFSEVVTGVDATDFGFCDGSVTDGWLVASVDSFDGGTTWTVHESDGAYDYCGNGENPVMFLDDDTVKNSAGVPVGGTGKGNGNFGPA